MTVGGQVWRVVLATLPLASVPLLALLTLGHAMSSDDLRDQFATVVTVVVLGVPVGIVLAALLAHLLRVPRGAYVGLVAALLTPVGWGVGVRVDVALDHGDGGGPGVALFASTIVLISVAGAALASVVAVALFNRRRRRGSPTSR